MLPVFRTFVVRFAIEVSPEFSIQYAFVILSLYKIGIAEAIPLLEPLEEYLPVFCTVLVRSR